MAGLQITFSQSTAGLLRQAMRAGQNSDRVLCVDDNLALGPLRPYDSRRRVEFLRDVSSTEGYGFDEAGCKSHAEGIDEAWKILARHTGPAIVWFSRRCAIDYCGFLELLSRFEAKSHFSFIDVSALPRKYGQFLTPGEMNHEFLLEFMSHAAPLDERTTRSEKALWERLVESKTPLRWFVHERLEPRDWNVVDELLFAAFAHLGQKEVSYRLLVGNAMCLPFLGREKVIQCGDGILFYRLEKLIADGRIICNDMRKPHKERLIRLA
jgi:hypothetical protein